MLLEIEDALTGRRYTGEDGFAIVTPNGSIVAALKTSKGEYIIEEFRAYEQVCILTNIYSEKDALLMVESLLPSDCKFVSDQVKFEGYRKYTTNTFDFSQKQKPITN